MQSSKMDEAFKYLIAERFKLPPENYAAFAKVFNKTFGLSKKKDFYLIKQIFNNPKSQNVYLNTIKDNITEENYKQYLDRIKLFRTLQDNLYNTASTMQTPKKEKSKYEEEEILYSMLIEHVQKANDVTVLHQDLSQNSPLMQQQTDQFNELPPIEENVVVTKQKQRGTNPISQISQVISEPPPQQLEEFEQMPDQLPDNQPEDLPKQEEAKQMNPFQAEPQMSEIPLDDIFQKADSSDSSASKKKKKHRAEASQSLELKKDKNE